MLIEAKRRLVFTKSTDFYHDRRPRTWSYLKLPDRNAASIVCDYGHYGLLVNHPIDDNGFVDPAVQCPVDGCPFHEYIRLDGWRR